VTSHDPNTTPNSAFPNLTPFNHRIVGPTNAKFNCIAWACDDTQRWWQPGPFYYWPIPCEPTEYWTVDNLLAALATAGFIKCEGGELEAGFEKLAIYAHSISEYTHAARQLPSGNWTSKLGKGELIEHDTPDAVAGGAYGSIVQFMKRPLASN
jgi:hypothetical protein